MAERILTLRELNRTTLLRQMLLERRRLRLVEAIERLGGLQAQWAPSPYVALWSRLAGFERRSLEHALLDGRVVKALLMRATQHLVPARDLPFLDSATLQTRTAARTHGTPALAARDVRRLAALARKRPRTRSELMVALGLDPRSDRDLRRYWSAVYQARLEQTPEAALWSFRGSPLYRPVDHALPPFGEAAALLVRRYLAAFGPASRADIAQWSGVPMRDLAPSLEALPLRTFRDESGRQLLDLPRAPLASADLVAPPRLLPIWEELLVAHADRRRVLADEHLKAAVGSPTFLVDGFVAGTWRVQRGRVVLAPFAPLPRATRSELEQEAKRLQAWLR
jgi:hypothetical protein